MRRLTRKPWIYIWIGIIIVLVGITAYVLFRPKTVHAPSSQQSTSSTSTQVTKTPANELRFAAMGDMLAHDTVNQQAKTGNTYDYKAYFTHIRSLYSSADVVFCNPETLVVGQQFGISGYPTFNAPNEFARDLASPEGAGCSLINTATNHIGDKSQAAINATLDEWKSHNVLAVAGANRSVEEQNTVRYFTKNGVKVAFLAFADYSNNTGVSSYGLNIYHNDALVTELMTEARSKADAVVVSMHWGTEDSNVVNPDQIAATKRMADLGADVVIGTGPHVLQQATWVTGQGGHRTLAWYSIGNMLSSQLQVNELTGGIAGFTLKKNSSGVSVETPTFKATFMSYDWSAADKAADNLLARHNLLLQPLASATGKPEAMFGSQYSVSERTKYVHDTLTSDAHLTITP